MLYYILYPLRDDFIVFNVFRYITFRALMAFFTALLIYFVMSPYFNRMIKKLHLWQTIRTDGPVSHMDKRGVPTMGGILIILSTLISVLLWTRLDNLLVLLGILVMLLFGGIGLCDDLIKIFQKDAHGLRARYKFPLQLLFAVICSILLFSVAGFDTSLSVPFFKSFQPNLGWFYIPFAMLVIVSASNAVNLTDGLDGLVSVPSIVSFFAYAVLAYIAGHMNIAQYLVVPFVPGAGELSIFSTAIVGALMAFLWFNSHPASIFMGDVGSLSLGAVLGYVAVATKNEFLLILIGGIFVLETVSVITQVISFQLLGKRIFRMAPIHHHFELKGWPENKVIVRFWIISFILALGSLATLKLR
ncbi:MAG: phospho-N-acetylmuramoyl-pentapeptide-transferase [Pseudomonadota bacterium]